MFNNKMQKLKKEAQKISKTKLESFKNKNKLTDFKECYSKKLSNFKNDKYIKKVCEKATSNNNNNDIESCQKTENFCNVCCESHIGIFHLHDLVDCKTKCIKVTNGLFKQ
jgi:hypothetical protein